MNVSPKVQKIILSVLILLGLGFVVYSTLFGDVPVPENLGEDTTVAVAVGQDILTLADKLQSTQIDTTIFSSPLFQSLIDISTPLTPEAQGRENPFAQIGVDSGASSPRPIKFP
ncbi:MAG: hypothetical protein CEO12_410 [Parcubacteria group bacterium Gr01-1014_46]|nr:MAG: hypothetical protein CEO12_410 [Parcubacteria group bacterium Gr01-1014_46]